MAGPDAQRDAKYKGAEVCRLADVQPYVLRYWESEFPFLAPNRNAAGPRGYSELDLQLIRRIKQLLYDEGYTIAGAKKRLEAELKKGVPLFDDAELGPAEPVKDVQLAGDVDLGGPPPFDPDDTGSGMAPKPKRKAKAVPPPPPPVAPDAGAAEEMEAEGGPAVEVAAGPASVPASEARSGRRNVPPPIPAPARPGPDPRLASTLAELREILAVLSKD